jgi:hypothetical protein
VEQISDVGLGYPRVHVDHSILFVLKQLDQDQWEFRVSGIVDFAIVEKPQFGCFLEQKCSRGDEISCFTQVLQLCMIIGVIGVDDQSHQDGEHEGQDH